MESGQKIEIIFEGMSALSFINRVYNRLSGSALKFSYAQSGEDVIMRFLIYSLNRTAVQYFDIGTNDPRKSNNTYLLYLYGYPGVCIEPNPYFHQLIRRYRPKDILVPGGVALDNVGNADFFIMDDSVLSTFSSADAERMQREEQRKVLEVIRAPLFRLNDLFKIHWLPGHDIILSVDVEGLDLDVLRSVDFGVYRPLIICAETLVYSRELYSEKRRDILEFLAGQNYRVYADTHINTIFLDNAYQI